MEFLSIYHNPLLGPISIISIVVALFLLQVFTQYPSFKKTGKFFHEYPANTFLFFAPIYEEVLFRGLIFSGLLVAYPLFVAITITSVLFALWHVRSMYFMSKTKTIYQILYAGVIIGPVFGYITFLTGDIWFAVILHYVNNILAPLIPKGNEVTI